ncbi:TPA: type II toxin-antitoxin system HicB family antitoxin [Candidatus Peregrinibacteria bacterium]|nr:type II toxin-antitoxin system HicB family antitoxin [Candidatus Peregrinibacteria bacterium]
MAQFAFVYKDENLFVAQGIEGIASQGETQEEAIENLKEALLLYYEDNEPLVKNDYIVTSFVLHSKSSTSQYDKIRV